MPGGPREPEGVMLKGPAIAPTQPGRRGLAWPSRLTSGSGTLDFCGRVDGAE